MQNIDKITDTIKKKAAKLPISFYSASKASVAKSYKDNTKKKGCRTFLLCKYWCKNLNEILANIIQ